MSKGVVSIGDRCIEATTHFCITGSLNVFVNGKSIYRQGDGFSEGKILTKGSKKVFVNGCGIGRVGDLVSCGSQVVSGSKNVLMD